MRSIGRYLRKVGEYETGGPGGRRRLVLFSSLAPRSTLAQRIDQALARLRAVGPPRHCGTVATVAFLVATVAYGTAVGGHMQTVGAGFKEAASHVTSEAGLAVRNVEISGHRNAREREIVRALDLDEATSLVTFDPYAARERLAEVDWVKSATVRKLFPDTLRVEVEESDAYALWQIGGFVSLIDRDGNTIAKLEEPRFASLPLVAGYGANRAAGDLIEAVRRHSRVAAHFRAAIRVGERRWNLRLDNGIQVRLPEVDPEGAIARLAEFDLEHDLLARDVLSIDMRLADRLVVRLPEAAAVQRQTGIQERRKAAKRRGERT